MGQVEVVLAQVDLAAALGWESESGRVGEAREQAREGQGALGPTCSGGRTCGGRAAPRRVRVGARRCSAAGRMQRTGGGRNYWFPLLRARKVHHAKGMPQRSARGVLQKQAPDQRELCVLAESELGDALALLDAATAAQGSGAAPPGFSGVSAQAPEGEEACRPTPPRAPGMRARAHAPAPAAGRTSAGCSARSIWKRSSEGAQASPACTAPRARARARAHAVSTRRLLRTAPVGRPGRRARRARTGQPRVAVARHPSPLQPLPSL